MADSTRVDPDALLAFANSLYTDLTEVYSGATASALIPAGLASIGGSGMQEAVWAGSTHAAALDAARQFVADTCDGLLALSYVAATVAEQYRQADADQAAQMAAVTNAFSPAAGQPSIAAQRQEHEAAAAAAALHDGQVTRYLGQLDRGTTPGSVTQGPDDAAGAVPVSATGATVQGNGPSSSQYSRYVNEVRTHNAFVSGGTGGATAEDEYSPAAEYEEAVDEAAFRSERDGIPWVVQVDDHGQSEVVQADPDDVPVVQPVDYTEPGFNSTATTSYAVPTSGD